MKRLVYLAIALFVAACVLGVVLPKAQAATLPDYTASISGPATVVQGGTFTRTLTVSNIGDGTDRYGVNGTINQVANAAEVSVTSTGFARCGVYKFSTGALNYVRCFNAVLAPGASATMTVTYAAPASGWLGWVYTGAGTANLVAPSMQTDSNPGNNYTGLVVNTTVVSGVAATSVQQSPCGNGQAAPATYKHVIIVMEENKKYPQIKNNSQAPYINSLMGQCSSDTKYDDAGFQFPSFPNYIALTSGGTQGFIKDCGVNACSTTVDNLFRQVRDSGGTVRSYAEGMPSNCYLKSAGTFVPRHVPAMYYKGGADRTACQTEVVPFSQFDPNNLPTLSFITPNLNDDMHNGTIGQADTWLQQNLAPVFNSPQYLDGSTLVLLLWDENTPAPNVFIAPTAVPNAWALAGVGHYSVLAVVEDVLGLPHLGQAATANTSWRQYMGF